MKKIFILWILFGFLGGAYSQTITITEQETNEPIDLVTLTNTKSNLYATTNSKGQADISAFKNVEKIEIRSLGYKTVIKS